MVHHHYYGVDMCIVIGDNSKLYRHDKQFKCIRGMSVVCACEPCKLAHAERLCFVLCVCVLVWHMTAENCRSSEVFVYFHFTFHFYSVRHSQFVTFKHTQMPFDTIDDALRKIFITRKQTPATRDILRAKDCEWVLSKYAGESFTNYFISQLSIEKWNFSYFIMVKWGFHFTRCTDAQETSALVLESKEHFTDVGDHLRKQKV